MDGWLLVVGSGNVARDVIPEVAKGGHTINPRPSFPVHDVGWGGAGWGVGNVGLVVAGAALGCHLPRLGISDKLSPPVDGGHPDTVSSGGRALAIRRGERRALVSGDVEEGVEEEVSNAAPLGWSPGRGGPLGCVGCCLRCGGVRR